MRTAILILMGVMMATTNATAEPADSQIKAAIYSIERAEQQSVALTAKNASKMKRVKRLVDDAATQLEASKNKSHESWKAAEQRLGVVSQRLHDIANPPAAEPSPQDTSNSNSQSSANNGSAGSTNQRSPAGTQSTQSTQSTDRPSGGQDVGSNGGAGGGPSLDGYDQAQLGTIERQTDGMIDRVQRIEQLEFSQERVASQWRRDVGRMKEMFSKVTQKDHPIAVGVAQKIEALDLFVEKQVADATAGQASLGDVKGRYDEIAARSRTFVPRPPDKPFVREEVLNFVQQLKALEAQAAEDNAWLRGIQGKTKAVAPSMIETLIHQTGEGRTTSIERAAKQLATNLAGQFPTADFFASSVADAKPQHFDRNLNTIQDAVALLDLVDAYESAMGVEVLDTSAKRQEYAAAIASYGKRSEEVIADTRFPKIRSTDKTLLAAAKEVLSRREYDVGKIERMEITYDKQRKTTAEGDIDWGAVVTTVTVTGYEWDEFAVTTAEKVGGDYYLYYNLFKFFHVGGTDVPTGKWTLGERRQSKKILKENIQK